MNSNLNIITEASTGNGSLSRALRHELLAGNMFEPQVVLDPTDVAQVEDATFCLLALGIDPEVKPYGPYYESL